MCVCQEKMHQLRGGMTGHVPLGYLVEYIGYSQWEILADMQPLYPFVAKIDRTRTVLCSGKTQTCVIGACAKA